MKRISYTSLALTALFMLVVAGSALADFCVPDSTPSVNGAVLLTRIWNDCPFSVLTTANNYPAEISIRDADSGCLGFANRHGWNFSADGGQTAAVLGNCTHFTFSANFVMGGLGEAEGGLRLSPWWSLDVDGVFMAKTANGEVACFGGRNPFFSFTGAFGVNYVRGENIWMEMVYNPHDLIATNPATLTYNLRYRGNFYTSGPLPYDEGNPLEGHGTWGVLNPARAGGYFMPTFQGRDTDITGTWSFIRFEGPRSTPTSNTSWGMIKTLYR